MKHLKLLLCAGGAIFGLTTASQAFADDQATPPAASTPAAAAPASPPAPTPPPYPSMGPTLSNNANSASFDAGPLGKLTVNGDLSGVFFGQSNPGYNGFTGARNPSSTVDLTNGLVTVQKDDGVVQFVVQGGIYSFPVLGTGYIKASDTPAATFGYLPVGYVKIVPNSSFSFEAGQLPTLIGAELPFTYENANIERGLLWNTEPLFSRGVQGQLLHRPLGGFAVVERRLLFQRVHLPLRPPDLHHQAQRHAELRCVRQHVDQLQMRRRAGVHDPVRDPARPAAGTGLPQPDLQPHCRAADDHRPTSSVQQRAFVDHHAVEDIWAGRGAVIAKYSFTPEISVAGRLEYEKLRHGAANLLYGPQYSNAVSLTVTPTYQKGIFYARIEGSYMSIGSGHGGATSFGKFFDKTNQFRAMPLESGPGLLTRGSRPSPS